jgi:hypothetical protein
MAATPLCEAPLAALKNRLRDEFPEVKSSHLSEALAASVGFQSHAALKAAMIGPDTDRPFALLRSEPFLKRLAQLGYPGDAKFDFEVTLSDDMPGVVSTEPSSGHMIEYKTPRERAWRNLMVCAVNAALEAKLFTLRPGDNRYDTNKLAQTTFDFVLPNGMQARGSIGNAGFDEVAIHAVVNPTGRFVSALSGFDAGDAAGMTWVERRRGAWMQFAKNPFRCRRGLAGGLADMRVEPLGYGDRGRVIM